MNVGRLGCGRRIGLATKSKLDDRVGNKARAVEHAGVKQVGKTTCVLNAVVIVE